jgi:hypothetical protein
MRVLSFDVAVKTLAYCILEHSPDPEIPTTIHAWEIVNVRDESGLTSAAPKPTAKEDCEMVLDALSRRREIFVSHPLDAVIIENQPGSLNNRFSNVGMKTVSHAIHAFFYSLQRFGGSGMGADSALIPVNFVSPNSKLAGMPKESQEDKQARQAGDRKAMGSKYKANKAYAVENTRELLDALDPRLDTTQSALTTFHAAPKKDDLADALMLAHAFCSKSTRKRARKK